MALTLACGGMQKGLPSSDASVLFAACAFFCHLNRDGGWFRIHSYIQRTDIKHTYSTGIEFESTDQKVDLTVSPILCATDLAQFITVHACLIAFTILLL